uniref:Uncharacterized protein n=1 Tax=Lepeophtheirus salmonis TaxID=72036 RepID=A0A0K2TP88_LEPSM
MPNTEYILKVYYS